MSEWLGGPDIDGDCSGRHREGWMCTAPAGHGGWHEAWGDRGDRPLKVWEVGGEDEFHVLAR
jgi:hypothetical protein